MALLLSHHHLFGQIPRNQLRKHNGQLIQIRNVQIPIPIDALDTIPVCPDGSCGMRELKAWVLSTMITKDPYESALSTVIASASADPENRADLITTCLEKQYMR